MNAAGIYQIVSKSSGRRYVGSATNMRTRFAVHRHSLRRGKHHSAFLQNCWNKHGESDFEFAPLLLCKPADLVMYEQIAMDALRPELNSAPRAGNRLGMKHSDESRARMSDAQGRARHFAGRKHSPETLALMSAAKRGNTYCRGKKRDPAAVEATAQAHRGMKRSEETRLRISLAMSGKKRKPRSEAHRKQLSIAKLGTKHSDATKQRISDAKRGKRLTAEHRAKIGDASRAMWARRKNGGEA